MSEKGEYGLVMPFVVCQSQDGPFDDAAFVAGVQFGDLLRRLECGEQPSAYVKPEIVPQLDLAAMHFGLRMATEPWDEHNTFVKFETGDTP